MHAGPYGSRFSVPRHKGKIEAGVNFAQNNALKGRTFDSLADQNRFLLDWETGVADTRIHGTTGKQVGKLFAEVERAALLPLPAERFPFFRQAQRSVHRDAHVEVDKAYYSVPAEFVGRKVWVRWDSHVVRIFDAHFHQLAIHARHKAGRFSRQRPHIAAEKIAGVERGTVWLLRKAALIGTETGRWAQACWNTAAFRASACWSDCWPYPPERESVLRWWCRAGQDLYLSHRCAEGEPAERLDLLVVCHGAGRRGATTRGRALWAVTRGRHRRGLRGARDRRIAPGD